MYIGPFYLEKANSLLPALGYPILPEVAAAFGDHRQAGSHNVSQQTSKKKNQAIEARRRGTVDKGSKSVE
jgi:hypothetical protein